MEDLTYFCQRLMCFGWAVKFSCPHQRASKPSFSCWVGVPGPCHPLGAPASSSTAKLCCAVLSAEDTCQQDRQCGGVSQIEELGFSLVLMAFFFPFLSLTGCSPLHLDLYVCVLGLGDGSSVLGPVSGICLVLDLAVLQSTASPSAVGAAQGRAQSSHSWYRKALS